MLVQLDVKVSVVPWFEVVELEEVLVQVVVAGVVVSSLELLIVSDLEGMVRLSEVDEPVVVVDCVEVEELWLGVGVTIDDRELCDGVAVELFTGQDGLWDGLGWPLVGAGMAIVSIHPQISV